VDYLIIFDGGSRNNGSPGAEAYDSYQTTTATGRTETKRLQFSTGTTNNEAEYKSLIAPWRTCWDVLSGPTVLWASTPWRFGGGSALVLDQVQGMWKTKKEHLRPLRDRAQAIIAPFKQVEFVWHPREESVEVLGH
jgi:ribonuclease HI